MVVSTDGTVGVKRGAKKGKKSRKHDRSYRWDGVTHSITKYRAKHGIGPGSRKQNKKLQS
jgi:hypothetical protein